MIVLEGDPRRWAPPEGGSAVAIGVFDGVHVGHRSLLAALDPRPPGARSVAMTFDPNPAKIVAPERAPTALTTLHRRLQLLAEAGLDAAAIVTFDSTVRTMDPEAFVRRYLVGGLGARLVAVGAGFRFGHGAAGDEDTLRGLGERLGFEVRVVPIVEVGGVPVRSTVIRAAIRAGNVVRAARLLGRPHEIEGTVVPGDGRGRRIGVPTANLELLDDPTLPAHGVYAVRTVVEGRRHPAVANVGVRPTFDGTAEVVEVHLLDVPGDVNLYGHLLRIEFVERLRGEHRFATVEALIDQIRGDIAAARRVLA